MPLTNFPNGISVTSNTANINASAGAGDLDAQNIYTAGTITAAVVNMNTANTMIGERAYIPIAFTSAATTTDYAIPFDGNIIDCWITMDTSVRVVSAFTLRAGSAGSVAVASVATLTCGSGSNITVPGGQMQPALTSTSISTASALRMIIGTAGSAVNVAGVVVLQRTA